MIVQYSCVILCIIVKVFVRVKSLTAHFVKINSFIYTINMSIYFKVMYQYYTYLKFQKKWKIYKNTAAALYAKPY